MNKNLDEIVGFLKNRLVEPLPGLPAHLEMIPYRARYVTDIPADVKQSAVLINLHEVDGKPAILLIKRVAYEGVHSAQVSFPGGRMEKTDTHHWQTALRENEEETGLPASEITKVGALTPIYIPPSKSLVHPFIGTQSTVAAFTPDTREVDYIFYLPVDVLLRDDTVLTGSIRLSEGVTVKDVPYFNYNNEKIWGATCAILNELKTILKEI